MNNTEVIFENIEQRILREIEDAHYAIFVSVAWFTNKKLFTALLEKARKNCYVSIIIQLDEINSQCGIDYDQIQIGRSECFKISKDAELLHDKFCVIDFKKVITGSYNWTYKASQNSENILILNDPSVAAQYITRFEQQKAKFSSVSSTASNICQQQTPPVSSPSTKLCSDPWCNKKIEYNDKFCPYCGSQQYRNYKPSIAVICKNCSYQQNNVLVDATRTLYCTNCGSDNLEWKSI